MGSIMSLIYSPDMVLLIFLICALYRVYLGNDTQYENTGIGDNVLLESYNDAMIESISLLGKNQCW